MLPSTMVVGALDDNVPMIPLRQWLLLQLQAILQLAC
jgi:hypothetical protein